MQIRYFFENIVVHCVWQIVSTRSDFLTQNSWKAFGVRVLPRPTGGAILTYSAPPNPLAGFKGATSWQGKTMKGQKGERRLGRGIISPIPEIPVSATVRRTTADRISLYWWLLSSRRRVRRTRIRDFNNVQNTHDCNLNSSLHFPITY